MKFGSGMYAKRLPVILGVAFIIVLSVAFSQNKISFPMFRKISFGFFGVPVDASKSNGYYFSNSKRTNLVWSPLKNWFELGYTEMKDADPATFSVLSQAYAKDKDAVYCNGNVLEGADPATFSFKEIGFFATDRSKVYLEGGVPVPNADPATFHGILKSGGDPGKVMGYTEFYADKDSVYYVNDYGTVRTIENADPKTFQKLGMSMYSKDTRNVYYHNTETGNVELLQGADAETFQTTDDGVLARDKKASYESGVAR